MEQQQQQGSIEEQRKSNNKEVNKDLLGNNAGACSSSRSSYSRFEFHLSARNWQENLGVGRRRYSSFSQESCLGSQISSELACVAAESVALCTAIKKQVKIVVRYLILCCLKLQLR